MAITEGTEKYHDRDEVRRQLQCVKDNWPELRSRLQSQCYTYDQMYRMLHTVGAPTQPEDVGISRSRMKADVPYIRQIRRRYGLPDLGLRAGLLDTWVDSVFGPGGVWEIK